MSRVLRTLPMLVAVAVLGAVPATAGASSKEVIKDCYEDGKIDGNYSDKELREAEDDLPSDVDEYSDCRSVIRAARARGRRGGGGGTGGVPGGGYGGGGGGGSDPSLSTKSGATASSREDLDSLRRETADRDRRVPEVAVAGRPIRPAAGATEVERAANGLPTSLIAALVGLAATCLAATALATRRRWPRLRSGPLRFRRR